GWMCQGFMEKVAGLLPEGGQGREPAVNLPKIAVVGRPNVGKSTFINSLLGKKRLVVTPVAGTTRDPIDVICTYYGRKYLFIDTAGIRRKRAYPVEHFSMVMAYRSIERADVAVVLIDASRGIVSDDQKIAGLVHESGKGAVFVLNKWDLLSDPENAYKNLYREFRRKLWFFGHAPMLAASGLERKAITKVFPLIDGVLAERRRTVSARDLDDLLEGLAPDLRLPVYGGRKVRVHSIRQIGKEPPVFALYSNEPAGLTEQNLKYFEKRLRERFDFAGTTIKVVPKRKK
nr:GTP-binding protein [Nitrospiraceae bacterium]